MEQEPGSTSKGEPFKLTGWARPVGIGTIVFWASTAHASLLSDVLERIARLGPSPLAAIMVNASVNAPLPQTVPRRMADGMRLIIGYDPAGNAVEATAGPDGLLVTPQTSALLQSGLAAGLYPIGSAVFSLPPAGQLSLYEADRNGARLERATEMLLAGVDGSVTTIIDGLLMPDLAPVQALARQVQTPDAHVLQLDRVTTTVLGAVNSGEIVSSIRIDQLVDTATITIDIDKAGIATGHSIATGQAIAGNAQAHALTARQIGGEDGVSALLLNLSVNASEINGAVITEIRNQTTHISSITTTVIGSVNSGLVAEDR